MNIKNLFILVFIGTLIIIAVALFYAGKIALPKFFTDIKKDLQIAGSCNLIKNDRQCFDYLGPAWTPLVIKSVCNNKDAVISRQSCPTANRLGGCHSMIGTAQENISWIYSQNNHQSDKTSITTYSDFCRNFPSSEWLEEKITQ